MDFDIQLALQELCGGNVWEDCSGECLGNFLGEEGFVQGNCPGWEMSGEHLG